MTYAEEGAATCGPQARPVTSSVLRVDRDGPVARVVLNRPDVRNAFNAELIAALTEAFTTLGGDATVRAIVLAGEGKTFSGGADLNWMRAALELTDEENFRDAGRMAAMYQTIDRCPKPVVGRLHGAALAGGGGLTAVCDIAIASSETLFGFTETKLGIIPAVISPYVIRKIGLSHARALFITGERFSADRAKAIGLVHDVVALDRLDARVDEVLAELATAGPQAVAAAKALIPAVAEATPADATELTVRAIARQRTTDEGQEGVRAFLERRTPSWRE